MSQDNRREKYNFLGINIDNTTYGLSSEKIIDLALKGNGGYACVANVFTVLQVNEDKDFREIINSADLVTADGMPLVWALRILGARSAKRVCGPALTPILCELAQEKGVPVGFYGSTKETLGLMIKNLKFKFPGLNIVYSFSPPFRALTNEEDEAIVREISDSGAKIIFVGLGCPKQETWMAFHKNRIPAVMVGVGAAFDFIAKTRKRSPVWMQKIGLEWLSRLVQEPARLWKRYILGNAVFGWLVIKEIMLKCLRGKKRCRASY